MCGPNLNYWISCTTVFQTVNFTVSIHQSLLESPVSCSAYQELKTSRAGIQVLLLCWTQKHNCIMENYFKRSIKASKQQISYILWPIKSYEMTISSIVSVLSLVFNTTEKCKGHSDSKPRHNSSPCTSPSTVFPELSAQCERFTCRNVWLCYQMITQKHCMNGINRSFTCKVNYYKHTYVDIESSSTYYQLIFYFEK